ncbi:hypothetical protein N7450_011452 [Penicillium hetheringtonii]|uniref:Uncharacterized protein n=1 Tax=Penicillium hetheringtonii TaxID=911720 RepID=A0AAD6DA92_9EURO|nr:hypothetical protein N7450_011452 [Penicillium hetheringtonii]
MSRDSRDSPMTVRKIQVGFQSDGEEKEKDVLVPTNVAADTNATWEGVRHVNAPRGDTRPKEPQADHSISAR